MNHHRIVTLLTDFGDSDGYAAAMKGVIATLAPDARIIDAAHNIPPQDIQAAAWTLMQYWSLYPEGTIHLAVVDPGVGTARRGLCVEADGRILIVPDNGIASLVIEQASAHSFHALHPDVHRPGLVSATFHGRDIFSYAAGLLAAGAKTVAEIAGPIGEIVHPSWARARSTATQIEGEVIHVDHFGNLVTNIRRAAMGDADWQIASLRVGAKVVTRIHRSYADVAPGAILALFGSSDTLEIAVNGYSALTKLGCGRGTKVCVEKGILARGLTPA